MRVCNEFVSKAAGCGRDDALERSLDRVPVKERIQEVGAYYNVGVRGARQLPIEFDDRDRRFFVRFLRMTIERFEWRCSAWCLMPNHFHLVIQITAENLSNGMYLLNHSFARWLNRRHGYCGHAFDRRFYADQVESDSHLFELVRYVVLNPVRAGLCAKPEDWPWSSHRAILGLEQQRFVSRDAVLEHFGLTEERAVARYASFVAEGLAPRPGPAIKT